MDAFIFDELKNPRVSIAVATYNGEKYLREQFDTLAGQDYANLEIVVSDDGSSDNTIAILEAYKSTFPSFTIVRNDGSKGIKGNFENAIAHCGGELIATCDQDDIWMTDKISKMVAALGRYALIYHDSLFVDESGKSLGKAISTRLRCYSGFDCRAFLLCNTVSGHALMFRRELIPLALPFPDTGMYDWWLAFRAAENGGVKYLDEVLVHYRQHTASQTDFYSLKRKPAAERLAEREKQQSDEVKWLEACEAAPGRHQKFIKQWRKLSERKKQKFLDLTYLRLGMAARSSLYAMRKKSGPSTFFFILRSAWGDDIRRITRNLKKKLLFQRKTEDDDLRFIEDI